MCLIRRQTKYLGDSLSHILMFYPLTLIISSKELFCAFLFQIFNIKE